jgi:hypothetical protein
MVSSRHLLSDGSGPLLVDTGWPGINQRALGRYPMCHEEGSLQTIFGPWHCPGAWLRDHSAPLRPFEPAAGMLCLSLKGHMAQLSRSYGGHLDYEGIVELCSQNIPQVVSRPWTSKSQDVSVGNSG